ncbi:hypothetical protein MNBD_CHLOROFLEXI01-117, partial [hydrothermal vent metagenome]
MNKNKLNRLFLILLAVGWLAWSGKPTLSAPPSPSGEPQIMLLPDGLQLVWQAAEPTAVSQPDGTMTLTMPNFGMEQTAGLPAVPTASVLVALPPEATPELLITETAVTERPFPHAISINPQPSGALRDAAGNAIGGDYIPTAQRLVTIPTLSLTEAGVLRGVRLARLTFHPVQLDNGRYQLTETVTATIQFNSPPSASRPANQPDLLQQGVAAQVINPSQLAVSQAQAAPAAKPAATSPTVLIEVDQPGITAVTYQNLLDAGFPVGSVNSTNLQLYYDGLERPLEWFGDGDAQFEAGESFRFYAAPWFNRWMGNDVYTLTEGGSPGSRMGSQSA